MNFAQTRISARAVALFVGMIAAALPLLAQPTRARAGMMYAATTGGTLYSVNPNTVVTTLVGPLVTPSSTPAFQFTSSLAFDNSGTLWGLDGDTGVVGSINTSTGVTTILNPTPSVPGGFISGITFDPGSGALIASDEGNGSLYSVSLVTGNYTLLGNMGMNASGIQFTPDGKLYAVAYGVGNIIQIDHHFMDQDMRQSLSYARIRCWRVPGCR